MAVSQRVQLLSDKSEELNLLGEFLKNPDLISDLANEVKMLNSLTVDEEKKLLDAKVMLRDYDQIKSDLEKREKSLSDAISSHESQVASDLEEHSAAVKNLMDATKSREDVLAEREAALSVKISAQIDKERAFASEQKAFADEKAAVMKKAAEDRQAIDKGLADVATKAAENAETKAKLHAYEQKLKDKAEALRVAFAG